MAERPFPVLLVTVPTFVTSRDFGSQEASRFTGMSVPWQRDFNRPISHAIDCYQTSTKHRTDTAHIASASCSKEGLKCCVCVQ